ncbi:SAM-dependent methyltransferase [Streptomyces oceani]|uniref:Cyclopropane-fatty-acyl-phospholipid synthase n=1 Tax=Streptomyces oceani TaxID=1075402 RepID=A0A1E7KJS9_9ACTN|nr:cyclopropane-fatty-acyl-phospholipid synthase family protein [Streptomyces oceani]OEV04175.1 cyclopropane-fatty-acyl-phospholipid synthase [Streptomyces oceani]
MTASAPGAPPGSGTRRPDPERWPDVAEVPRCGRARAALAQSFVRRAVARLPLCVTLPDGRTWGRGGPRLELRDPVAFHRRIAVDGLIGFGESYQAGEWEAPDLVAVLTVLAAEVRTLVPQPLQRLRGMYVRRRPAAQRNTTRGARDNIHRHYDLSNDLFASFLDPGMSYSAAVFRTLPANPSHLWAAQQRKVDRLLDLAGVGPGSRLLEIGTGWGELALRAAERGAEVVTITLSEEQRRYAQRRVAEADPPGRVDVLLRDYREVTGHYDAIVSVEMIEAVGAEFWPEFLRVLDRRLAPDGRVALQAITMPHDRMLATRDTYTWIQKYVFPGGMLPSEEAVARISAERTSLRLTRSDGFGPHYAETLRLWRERFTARTRHVRRLGFDETFQRMWTFYLGYSEAGFRSGYLDVRQLLLEKPPLQEGGESST